jgi:hypothetical protein
MGRPVRLAGSGSSAGSIDFDGIGGMRDLR